MTTPTTHGASHEWVFTFVFNVYSCSWKVRYTENCRIINNSHGYTTSHFWSMPGQRPGMCVLRLFRCCESLWALTISRGTRDNMRSEPSWFTYYIYTPLRLRKCLLRVDGSPILVCRCNSREAITPRLLLGYILKQHLDNINSRKNCWNFWFPWGVETAATLCLFVQCFRFYWKHYVSGPNVDEVRNPNVGLCLLEQSEFDWVPARTHKVQHHNTRMRRRSPFTRYVRLFKLCVNRITQGHLEKHRFHPHARTWRPPEIMSLDISVLQYSPNK